MTAQKPSPEKVVDTPGITKRVTYDGQGVSNSWALGLCDERGPAHTPQAGIWEAGVATCGDEPTFLCTSPERACSQACPGFCISYPLPSQNSNLRPSGSKASWDLSAGPLTLGRPVTWSGWGSGVVTELVEGVSGALGALGWLSAQKDACCTRGNVISSFQGSLHEGF